MSEPAAEFEKTYQTYYTEIRRFIFTIARQDPDITDDISQSTWQNAYSYYGSLRDPSSVRSWLYAIARNEAKRYFSNRHTAMLLNASSLEGDDEPIDLVSEKDSEFPDALASSDLLAGLLGRLSTEEQRLILLHYAYDVGLKEIADMEGTNYNTLKSTFRRAMEKLRKAAGEMGTDER
jgi:RNA polymerase sigma-70 factor (ECF subfamily)